MNDAMEANTIEPQATAPKRSITLRGATFIGIGSMVGAGIFALFGEAGAIAGAIAPSQPGAAVAGVQLASRQHSSLVPFFQTSSRLPFIQLSIVCAPAAVTSAAEANNIATLLSFFMVLL